LFQSESPWSDTSGRSESVTAEEDEEDDEDDNTFSPFKQEERDGEIENFKFVNTQSLDDPDSPGILDLSDGSCIYEKVRIFLLFFFSD